MGETTHIEWATFTASPWYGCTKVSAGCTNCYAESWAKRGGRDVWGPGKSREASKSFDRNCTKWNKEAAESMERPRVFPSLCDPFDEGVPIELFNNLMLTVEACPRLDFLMLTKRPQNVIERWAKVRRHWARTDDFLPNNVWLGVSIEDQKRADERIPLILEIPARVRWLSVEPMLEPISLRKWWSGEVTKVSREAIAVEPSPLDWVVIGGESGPNRRDCGVGAIIDAALQCSGAGIPVFVKQDCAMRPGQQGRIPDEIWKLKQFPKQ